MPTTYAVDASVFLNACNPHETGHDESRRLLSLLQERAIPIIAPTLLLPEVAAAIGRGRGDTQLAIRFSETLRKLPHLVLVPLGETLARQAANVAAQCRLRGSDAVYAAVALRFGGTLVTLDRQQRESVAQVLPTVLPEEAYRSEIVVQ